MAYNLSKQHQVRSNKPKKIKRYYKPKPKKKRVQTPVPAGEKKCAECGATKYLSIHHCFGGSSRDNSSIHGCVEWLCYKHHQGDHGVHQGNTILDLRLKRKHQSRLEENGMDRNTFIFLFGRNYLTEG